VERATELAAAGKPIPSYSRIAAASRRRRFLSARLFLTEDGEKIVEHFQWMDRAAYEVYRASDLGKAAASLLVTLHPQVFFLREMEVIV
jgi:hypothetical protein